MWTAAAIRAQRGIMSLRSSLYAKQSKSTEDEGVVEGDTNDRRWDGTGGEAKLAFLKVVRRAVGSVNGR